MCYHTDSEDEYTLVADELVFSQQSQLLDFYNPFCSDNEHSLPSFGYVFSDLEWRCRWLSLRIVQLESLLEAIPNCSPVSTSFSTCTVPFPVSHRALASHPLLALSPLTSGIPFTTNSFLPHPTVHCLSRCNGFRLFFECPPIRLPHSITKRHLLLNEWREQHATKPPTPIPDVEAVKISSSRPKKTQINTSINSCQFKEIDVPGYRKASPFIDVSNEILDQIDDYDSSDEYYLCLHQQMQDYLRESDFRIEKKISHELKVFNRKVRTTSRSRCRLSGKSLFFDLPPLKKTCGSLIVKIKKPRK
ncbi:hypothetical protein P9112_005760 [Eukaryota sp. TZLM1-RC]